MRKRIKNYKKMCVLLIMSLLISSAPMDQAQAASGLKIYNYTTSSSMTITEKTISYVYNGKSIPLGDTPGILSSNGVALGPYVTIFRDTLGIKTLYNKEKKTVTLRDGKTTLVLTLGSKTAVVNGKSVTMNAAPISIKYSKANKTAILVPTRFVAETFGFSYNWDSTSSTVTITKPLNLFYDNKSVSYTGTQGAVKFDGKKVNVSDLPSILIANTAMTQAYKVFAKSMGVTYKYSASKGTISFKKGDISLLMELGSNLAYLNDQVVDCGVAPKLVYNEDNGTEVVLVPAQFVSKALGYDYTWNSSMKTSEIKTTSKVGKEPNLTVPPVSPSTPDDGNLSEADYFNWTSEESYQSILEELKNALNADNFINTGSTNVSQFLKIDADQSASNKEKYQLTFDQTFSNVTASKDKEELTLTFDNMIATDGVYSFGNELVKEARVIYDAVNNQTDVIFTLSDATINYAMTSENDGKELSLSIYPNYLTQISAGRDENGSEYLTVTGLQGIKPIITEDEDSIYLSIPNTINTLGDYDFSNQEESTSMVYVTLRSTSSNNSFLIIQKKSPEVTYEIHEDGSNFTVYIGQEEVIPEIDNTPLKITLPSGVRLSDISSEDNYHNKQISIRIKGDHRSFFEQNPIANTYENVANIKVSYSASKGTEILITTNVIQGFEYTIVDGKLQVTIDRPSAIYDKIIILDAGHGGKDPGAVKGNTQEKAINFKVLNEYAKDYFTDSGIKVYYTRIDDTLIPLADRASFAKQVEADFFISLHCNSSTSSAARGTSVYYSSTNTSKTSSGLTSKILANTLVNNLSKSLGTRNLGIIDKGFVVVRDNSVPAVLIELAFLSNPSDLSILTNPTYQKKAAKTIYDTVASLFEAYPTKR